VSTTAQDLIISGENLAETTSVRLAVATGGDPIELTIDPARRSMDQLRVIFPGDVPRSLVGALLTLTLIAPAGTAEAQVFFLQGESPYECDDEGHCTLTGHLTVDGALDVTGNVNVGGDAIITGDLEAASGTFDLLTAEELMVSVWEPECPRGYQRDETREDIVLCERGRDQMVKVGDFWVDRYEATVSDRTSCDGGWYGRLRDDYPATFLDSGQVSNTVAGEEHRLFACSVSGGTPSRLLTWFQAQVACAASGKHLIANAEWQAAVEGTVDPGSSSADVGHCLTNGGNPRPTGSAGVVPVGVGSCISLWGAEDMIGNLNEWTSDWWQAGLPWVAADGQSTHPWSGILNDDITVNINGRTTDTGDRYVDGLPAAVIRGGDWGGMLGAGAFNTIADVSPVFGSASIGFRCARSY
jgi:formylglycine-generating enzyme required for sulfatase activity